MNRIEGTEGHDALNGTTGDDRILGFGGDDRLDGYLGDDVLRGGLGNDELHGGDGTDTVFGGGGDDTLIESAGGDTLRGGSGDDWLSLSYRDTGHAAITFALLLPHDGQPLITPDGNSAYGVERLHVDGTNFDDTFVGGTEGDFLDGWVGNDNLVGLEGDDSMYGWDGRDVMYGGDGNDRMYGGHDNDRMYGGAGDDDISGAGGQDLNSAHDVLEGGPGADTFHPGFGQTDLTYRHSGAGVYADLLAGVGFGGDAQGDIFDTLQYPGFQGRLIGSAFNDRLVGALQLMGGRGDDVLVTRTDTEIMKGGAGRDTFQLHYDQYQLGTPHITDFNQAIHEIIDVSDLDALASIQGDQAFEFIGTDAFSHRGQLRYEVDGNVTLIQMNTGHDTDPEFSLALDGAFTLTPVDFIL